MNRQRAQKDYGNAIHRMKKRFTYSTTALLFYPMLGWGMLSGLNDKVVVSETGGAPDAVCSSVARIVLRSVPEMGLSPEAVQIMLKNKGLFDARRNSSGAGVSHTFEMQKDGRIVYDRADGLTWQQAGSRNEMNYQDAKVYVSTLNKDRFAGYDDWRLPTLEEAISLVETAKKGNNSHASPLFDQCQIRIWTSDFRKEGAAWVVWFDTGFCDYAYTDGNVKHYVRAVRVKH